MGRILAIDYGRKRSGIAVTDPLRITANGLETVPTHQLMDFLKNYVSKEKVDIIVIGKPTRLSGEDSENMQYITPFVNQLRKTFPGVEIVFADERFTSVLAHKTMLDAGLKKKDRQDKALVDKISATIILQGYLNGLAN